MPAVPAVTPAPPLVESIVVAIAVGENKALYDKGRRVTGVSIQGMRNKPLRLRRVLKENLDNMMPGARGVPTCYALEFKECAVYLWPHVVHDMNVIINYGDLLEDTGEKT